MSVVYTRLMEVGNLPKMAPEHSGETHSGPALSASHLKTVDEHLLSDPKPHMLPPPEVLPAYWNTQGFGIRRR